MVAIWQEVPEAPRRSWLMPRRKISLKNFRCLTDKRDKTLNSTTNSVAGNLPLDVALDIFSRLSSEFVLICKQVCKTWHNHLSLESKNFAKIHMRRDDADSKVSNHGLIFLLKSEKYYTPHGHHLHYGEYDENNNTVQKTLALINHPHIRTRQQYDPNLLVGSCNGLICLAQSRKLDIRDPIHICNPITRECLYLPGFNKNNEYQSVRRIYSGFGYSTRTNEYKVVRILYFLSQVDDTTGHIQVYTLGDGNGWRNKGLTDIRLSTTYGSFANGALHWIESTEKKMVVFDLSDEEFHVLPSGPHFNLLYSTFSFLRSWGELLYGVGFDGKCFHIWSFKKLLSEGRIDRGTTTTSNYNEYESWSWCKEFSVTQPSPYVPFAITKSGLVIVLYSSTISFTKALYAHNPETNSLMFLLNDFHEVIPHANSLVSLKGLGETTCKKRKLRAPSSGGVEDNSS